MPNLFAELLRRGYSESDCAKIASGNILRALATAETVSVRLRREQLPGEAAFVPVPTPAVAPK